MYRNLLRRGINNRVFEFLHVILTENQYLLLYLRKGGSHKINPSFFAALCKNEVKVFINSFQFGKGSQNRCLNDPFSFKSQIFYTYVKFYLRKACIGSNKKIHLK